MNKRVSNAWIVALALVASAALPATAGAQTLVAPASATATNGFSGSYGPEQMINGNGLNGNDLSATHDRITATGYANKFWLSNAGIGHPQTFTYNFNSETLSGVAIWNSAFVLPLTSHYTYDGTITDFELEIDHSGGTIVVPGLTMTEDNVNAQTFDFCTSLTGVTQIRIISRGDNRPQGGSDRNLYMSEFRGVSNGPAANCIFGTTIITPADGSTLGDGTPEITGTFTAGGTVSLTITDAQGNVVDTATVVADGSGAWSYTSNRLTAGDYTVTASVNDPNIGPTSIDSNFTLALCGNNVLDNGEQCDGAAQGCDATCTIEPGFQCSCAAPNALADVSAATTAGIVGGNGGGIVGRQDCPDGQVLIGAGFEMSNGNGTVTRSRLICGAISIDAQGTVTTTQTSTLTTAGAGCAGWDPSTATADSICPSGTALTGMSALRVGGTTFSDISITCTPIAADRTLDAAQSQTILVAGTDTGAGSTATAAACGANQVMMGFDSRAGCGQDSIEPFCAPLFEDCSEQASVCEDVVPPVLTVDTPTDGTRTTDSVVSVNGTSEAGATIDITLTDAQGATVETLQTTADGSGNWTIDSSQLVDGSYTFTVTASDASNNTSAPISTNFEVDTTAPMLTLTTPTDGSATNNNVITVSGTTEANAAVEVTVTDGAGTMTTLPTTADASGNFSVDTAMLADGDYVIAVTAADALGNTSAPAAAIVTVDTMAPILTLTTPVDGTLTNNGVITVSGTSEAAAGIDIIISSPMIVLQPLQTTADGSGNFTIDTSDLASDTYQFSVTAADAVGNTSAPVVVSVTVDKIAPVVAITNPTAGQTVAEMIAVDGTTEADTALVLSLQDANQTEVANANVVSDAQGAWSGMFTANAMGTYTIVATATDAAGNAGSDQVTVNVDLRTPMITLEGPADGDDTNEVRPSFTGSVDLAAGVEVVILDDQGNEVGRYNGMTDMNGTFTVAPDADLPDGTYTAEVTATGANDKSSTTTITFTIDTVAPTLTIATPADGMVSNMAMVLVTGTTEPSLFVGAAIFDAQDVEVFNSNIEADAQGAWTIDAGNLDDGVYTVIATALDNAGNEAMAGPNTFTIDSTAPSVTIDSPTMGERVTTLRPSISGTADAGLDVTVTLDGQELGTVAAGNDGSWSIDPSEDLSEGEHTVSASATDAVGNAGSSGDVTFTVDLIDPLTVTSPEDGSSIPATGEVTVTGTGEPGTEITVTIGDQTTTTTVDDEGNWSVTIDPTDATEGTITVVSGEETVTITVTLDPGMVDNADPGNQDPGNQDPGNQDPGTNMDPGTNNDPGTPGDGGNLNGGAEDGCGCSTQSAPGSPGSLLLVLGLLGLGRIRRRQR